MLAGAARVGPDFGAAPASRADGAEIVCGCERRALAAALSRSPLVKLICAVIKPFKLDEVREALVALEVHGMTVTEVKGYGRQKGHTEIYRGSEYAVTFLPKIKVEIAVSDGLAEKAVAAIQGAARTGQIGDGKVFVQPLDRAVRIRTAETGDDAL